MKEAGIILVGLGPGEATLITRQAWEILGTAEEIYLRTSQHPAVVGLPDSVHVFSFDHLYEHADTFETVYAEIVDRILELGRRPQGVIYAVPGHPFIAEATCPEIASRARQEGLPVMVIEGLSFLEPTFTALNLDPLPRLSLVDALELAGAHVPSFPPDYPAIIAQIHSPAIASEVKLTLMEVYPDDHPVRWVHAAGTPRVFVEAIPLHLVDHSPHVGLLSTLYVPPLEAGSSFEAFQEIIAHLRAPEGCPWDREQTHQTLRPHLLEETYELLSALDSDDPVAMREELGDLLLQIVLHAQIANEYGEFSIANVIQGIQAKIIRRHPHVFGNVQVDGVGHVLLNWEKLKEAERQAKGKPEKGIMDGVVAELPALAQAEQYTLRAARVGFDWSELKGVWAKVNEEMDELHTAETPEAKDAELGDVLFALVNLARWYRIDPESALRQANARFRRRFEWIEKQARLQNKSVADLSMDEMESYWQQAKTDPEA